MPWVYGITGGLITIGLAIKLVHYIHGKHNPCKNGICEVLFTNPSSKCCQSTKPDDEPCSNSYCMRKTIGRIVHYIGMAESSVCTAMNIFTHELIYKALCEARERGVTVQVLFDSKMSFMTESKAKDLQMNGNYQIIQTIFRFHFDHNDIALPIYVLQVAMFVSVQKCIINFVWSMQMTIVGSLIRGPFSSMDLPIGQQM